MVEPWKSQTIGQNDTCMKQKLLPYVLIVWVSPMVLIAQNFSPETSPEKVFVHTDKPYYLTGETLWFQAYCTNLSNGHLTELSSVLYVELLNSDNQPVMQVKTSLKSGIGHGQILLSTKLATGSYVLRAYTAWMRNHHQKYFYQQRIMVFNPLNAFPENSYTREESAVNLILPSNTGTEKRLSGPTIKIITNKEIYSTREAVMVDLVTSGNQEDQVYTLSVAVYPYYHQLESIGNNILFNAVDPEGQELSAEQDKGNSHYFPETVGPIIYGKIEIIEDDDIENNLFVSIAGKAPRTYEVVGVDSNNFAVELPPGIDYEHLYFWSTKYQETNITLLDPFDKRPPESTTPSLQLDSSTIEFIEGQSVNMQVSNLYQEYTKIHGYQKLKTNRETPFYGQPESQYYLDGYTRFPSLEEVFVEYIRPVSYRRKGGSSNFYVWDEYTNIQSLANNVFFDQPALVMLDGIPMNDPKLVMNIDPLLVESIDVVTKKYFIGNKVFSGLVNLKTYNQDFAGIELPLIIERKSSQSIQNPMEFYHPDYGEATSVNSRIPDRRNTLYWNPDISMTSGKSAQLQFYTGDATGAYLMVINGITTNGTPLYQTKKISVIKRNTP